MSLFEQINGLQFPLLKGFFVNLVEMDSFPLLQRQNI